LLDDELKRGEKVISLEQGEDGQSSFDEGEVSFSAITVQKSSQTFLLSEIFFIEKKWGLDAWEATTC
jgi:hypothetical protein